LTDPTSVQRLRHERWSGVWLGLVPWLGLLGLNLLLSFENVWPTPAIKPDHRISAELVLAWSLLLIWVGMGKAVTTLAVRWISIGFVVLVIGRYFEVTVPALFGRGVNLYWDGQQLPRLIWTGIQGAPWWATALIAAGVPALLFGLYRTVRWCWTQVAGHCLGWALKRRWTWALSIALVGVSLANFLGVQATWPYISKPVVPTYVRQARLLGTALLPGALERVLPASPRFDAAPIALKQADVNLIFLESYGAVVFDNPQVAQALAPSHQRLAESIQASGLHSVAGFVRSATFGGASELAHLSVLSGIDLSDPLVHDLLLTSKRPTLVSWFKQHGYHTVGVYPALSWDWDERKFYGFDQFIDGRDLKYQGPKLGYWWTPDQFTMARIDELAPAKGTARPRFLMFPTITTHIPFAPVPPLAKDRTKLLSDIPFEPEESARAMAEPVDWLKLGINFQRIIAYQNQWLSWYFEQARESMQTRPAVYILIGDHQPSSVVSGEGAPWDVPVYILSPNADLLADFQKLGFTPGLIPARPVLGGMDDFTRMLEAVFTGRSLQ
jgi:hypothetical protein